MASRIAPLQPEDRAAWEVLARGYKAFYNTPTNDAEYTTAWNRLLAHDGVYGLAAFVDGQLSGIAHYLFHTSTWAPTVCYLQDLFTLPAARSADACASRLFNSARGMTSCSGSARQRCNAA